MACNDQSLLFCCSIQLASLMFFFTMAFMSSLSYASQNSSSLSKSQLLRRSSSDLSSSSYKGNKFYLACFSNISNSSSFLPEKNSKSSKLLNRCQTGDNLIFLSYRINEATQWLILIIAESLQDTKIADSSIPDFKSKTSSSSILITCLVILFLKSNG